MFNSLFISRTGVRCVCGGTGGYQGINLLGLIYYFHSLPSLSLVASKLNSSMIDSPAAPSGVKCCGAGLVGDGSNCEAHKLSRDLCQCFQVVQGM